MGNQAPVKRYLGFSQPKQTTKNIVDDKRLRYPVTGEALLKIK